MSDSNSSQAKPLLSLSRPLLAPKTFVRPMTNPFASHPWLALVLSACCSSGSENRDLRRVDYETGLLIAWCAVAVTVEVFFGWRSARATGPADSG